MSTSHWPAQQHAFALALLDPELPAPEFLRVRTGAALAARFDVYRNNVHAGLADALLAAFPVTARLTGEEFFRALAYEFLRQHLPHRPALHDYGAELPGFIRDHAQTIALPWLGDVAALEHAWWQSYGAADAPALALDELAAVQGEQLLTRRARLHPAARLLASMHPVHGIWSAHQQEGEPVPPERWDAECALITRPEATVLVRRVTAGAHAFLHALGAGATLEGAAETALALDPDFDLGTTLLRAIEAGAIQELHP